MYRRGKLFKSPKPPPQAPEQWLDPLKAFTEIEFKAARRQAYGVTKVQTTFNLCGDTNKCDLVKLHAAIAQHGGYNKVRTDLANKRSPLMMP